LDKETTDTIIQLVKEKKPATVEQLVNLMKEKYGIPEEKTIERVLQLQSEGKITLQRPLKPTSQNLIAHLKTEAYWYWTTLTLAAATTLIVFAVPEDAYPLVYIRYVLGSIFVLWLPGYTFIKALFPTKVPIQTSSEDLDKIERVALSIGMSIALVPIVGLLLNYTPWGIRLTPITLSLLALSTIFATAAVIREHQTEIEESA